MRKATGSEVKRTRSVRIEPKKHDLIAKHHGTFQKWIDAQVEKEVTALKGGKPSKKAALVPLTPKEKAKFKKVVDEMF